MLISVCQGCGKTISGAYVTALGHAWHAEHFVCGLCGKPINEPEFLIDKGKAHHRRCAEDRLLPCCALCSQSIYDGYLVDAWGRHYCERHEGGAVPCGGCGAPVGSGEAWCAKCGGQVVRNETELSGLYREVARWGERLGLGGVDREIQLSFASRRELARALGGGDGSRFGITKTRTYTSFFGKRSGPIEIEGIAVLDGIPAPLCCGVLAHEMGHVWFALCGISGAPRLLEEGFCEYLAHRYYGEHAVSCREHYRKGIEQNPDPVYGEGFRRVSRQIGGMGISRFLMAIRRGENI